MLTGNQRIQLQLMFYVYLYAIVSINKIFNN